jgi:hypothetical protein
MTSPAIASVWRNRGAGGVLAVVCCVLGCGGHVSVDDSALAPGANGGAAGAGGGAGGSGAGTFLGGSGGAVPTADAGVACSTAGSGGDAGPRLPPAPSTDAMDADADAPLVTFAITYIYFGDTTWDGVTSSDAWVDFGYDLDTLYGGATRCIPSSPSDVCDGPGGVDNSFARNRVILQQEWAANGCNFSISQGSFSLVIRVKGLGPSTDYKNLTVDLFAVESDNVDLVDQYPGPWRTWDEQLDPSSATATNPDDYIAKARLQGYLTGNQLVAGTSDSGVQLDMRLFCGGGHFNRMYVYVTRPTLTVTLSADHQEVLRGTIAGIVPKEAFLEAVPNACPSCSCNAYDPSLDALLQRATDMRVDADGSGDQACDGISVALGFVARRSTLGPSLGSFPADTFLPCWK